MSGGRGDFDAGRKVGKYEILTRLSMGGMAELFLAFTAGPGGFKKFVALKQILPDVKADEAFVKMFLDEARITAAFSHANIGQVFDLGEEDGELYLAMEYISGQNLEQIIRAAGKAQREIPWGFGLLVARDTALALHYAHHFVDPSGRPAPAVHRDVSPKNVMVTFDGNVKVIDFGIAKAKGRLGRTSVGVIKGTTTYMSPEQIRNQELDGRSDLFAVGVMLHELLTGQRLFDGANDATTMYRITHGEFPSPREVNPKVPKALSEVVMRALAVKREERFATGKELARAIEAAAATGGEATEIFDEEFASSFMHGLFAERVKKNRELLELANRDDGSLGNAAEALRDELRESNLGRTPKRASTSSPGAVGSAAARTFSPGRTPTGGRAPLSRTPAPRSAASSPRMPEAPPRVVSKPVLHEPTLDEDVEEPEDTAPRNRFKSEVAQAYALYDEAAVATQELKGARRPVPPPANTAEVPKAKAPERKRGGFGKAVFWVVLLGMMGGAGWAFTRKEGPVAQAVQPVKDAARAWYADMTKPEPGAKDAAMVPLQPQDVGGPPPQAAALIAHREAEEEAARQRAAWEAAEAERAQRAAAEAAAAAEQKAAEEAAAAKSGTKGSSTAKAQTTAAKTPDAKGAAVAAAGAGAGAGAQPVNTQKPVKPTGGDSEEELPATTVQDTTDILVVDTRSEQAAAKAGLGFLTLVTVPSAWVFDGSTALGASPLQRVPLPKGVYRLRLRDADGKYRTLGANIQAGKESKMTIQLADLPLDAAQD